MRYHYKQPHISISAYGKVYSCDHPVYNACTLFTVGDRGLSVIQQRYDPKTKHTWWGPIDDWIADDLYLNSRFIKYFDTKSRNAINGIYPTVTIRQIMWALRMKPLKREPWETVFDHSPI